MNGNTLLDQQLGREAEPAPRYYCTSCGHNAPDERCADPIVPPQYAMEMQAIHRATIVATTALAAQQYVGYPMPIVLDRQDIEAIEAFIKKQLSRHIGEPCR